MLYSFPFYPKFAQLCRNVSGGILLSYLWDQEDDLYFEWTLINYEEIQNTFFLNRAELDNARKKLKELGILLEKKEDTPCRIYYQLDMKAAHRATDKLD